MNSFFILVAGQPQGPYTLERLRQMAKDGSVRQTTMLKGDQGDWFPAQELPDLFSTRDGMVAMLLSIFLGTLGADRFYVGHIGLGVLKLLTLGGCGIWHLIDIILFASNRIVDDQGRPLRR